MAADPTGSNSGKVFVLSVYGDPTGSGSAEVTESSVDGDAAGNGPDSSCHRS